MSKINIEMSVSGLDVLMKCSHPYMEMNNHSILSRLDQLLVDLSMYENVEVVIKSQRVKSEDENDTGDSAELSDYRPGDNLSLD